MPFRIRNKLFIVIGVLSLTLFLASYYINEYLYKRNIGGLVMEDIRKAEHSMHEHEVRDTQMLSAVLEVFLRDRGFKEVFLAGDREKLYEYGQPLFRDLKEKYGITHFYFHLPDGRNFVRLHNKDIYGDKVERITFKKAQSTGGIASGVELGKTAFALRVVAPYRMDGRLIGYVELGQEIDHFLDSIKKETGNEFAMFARKEFLSREDWRSVRAVSGLPENWDKMERYLLLSKPLEHAAARDCFIGNNLIPSEKGPAFIEAFPHVKLGIACGGFPIHDAEGKQVGVTMSLIDISKETAMLKRSRIYFITAFIFISFIVFFAISLLVRRSISMPIEAIHRRADSIARGNFKGVLDIRTGDELEQLANAVNEMAAQLDSFVSNLQGMVEDRTAGLRESEERFRIIFDNAIDGILLADVENKRFYTGNKSICAMLGYTLEEIKSLGVTDIHPEKDLPYVIDQFERQTRGEFTLARDIPVKRKDGSVFYADVNSVPIQLAGKTYLVGVFRDITERKQAEEALKFESDKLIKIFEAMEDGVYIVNQNYDIEYINPSLEKEYGPWKGIKCYTYFHDRTEVCPWCPNLRVWAGETVRWECYSFKNGKTYDLLDTLLRNPDGSVSKLEIFRDITDKKKAEEALRESEERYRRLVESVTDYIFTVEVKDGRPVKTTHGPSCVAITGYTSEEYEAEPNIWLRMVYEDDKAKVLKQASDVLSGKAEPLEHRIITKDGRIKWVRNVPVPHYDEKGRLVSYDGLISDITERKEAEEALKESEERFRAVAETASDAIICLKSPDAVYLWNKKAEEMFGYSADHIIGRSLHEIIVPDRYRERAREGLRKFFETGNGPLIGKTIEIEALRKDDTEFPIELSISAMNVKGEWQATGIIRDITERKKAEEALRKSENKYRTLLQNLEQKIFYKDRNSVYISCNENYARDLKIKADEIQGRTDYDFYPKELAEKYRADDKRLMELGKAEEIEEKYIQDGQEVWVHTVKTPIRDDSGNVIGILGIFWDITERKRKDDMLNQRLDELTRFEKATIQREFRMRDLKEENKRLKERIGEMEGKGKG